MALWNYWMNFTVDFVEKFIGLAKWASCLWNFISRVTIDEIL